MDRFILDTSVFTNPDVYRQFGENTLASIGVFLDLAEQCQSDFYMPASVYDELCLIKHLDGLKADFERVVHIRSPRRYQLQIPAEILYELIDEVRVRIDRGLRVAEEHAKMGHGDDTGRVITRLRERYREVLRRGIIDSREDVDVLLLAYELDAALVSADEGLRTWADKVGVRIVSSRHLRRILEGMVGQQDR